MYLTNGTVLPRHPNPIATPTMFCSAIKHSTNCSGRSFFNKHENVELLMSPSKPITRLLFSPNLNKALP